MNIPYIIVFEDIPEGKNKDQFIEAITTTFVSKKSSNNSYVISADDKLETKQVYEKLNSKLKSPVRMIIISLDTFYGEFTDDSVFPWLKEQFPNLLWV